MHRKRARFSIVCISLLVFSFSVESLSSLSFGAQKCEDWIGRVVSVQGVVRVQKAGELGWVQARLDDTYCAGDTIEVLEQSRAAVLLRNDVVLRFDQNTTVTFIGPDVDEGFLLRLLSGALHLFSRSPRPVRVITPHVNAAVGGTEFFIKVETNQATVSVFEGTVSAVNDIGSVSVGRGQTVVARAGQAPSPVIVVRPRDAVQWALYYPPILDYRPSDFEDGPEGSWQAKVRRSLELYWENDLEGAFSSLDAVPAAIADPRFLTYRAGLFLTVGRVDEARADIEKALLIDPMNSRAFALQSVIAVTQSQKETALKLAEKAAKLDPGSSAARVALSYARQANADLKGAQESLKEAVRLDPENALAWARLAEVRLSLGNLREAFDAAQRAVLLRPKLARTQTVLGFAYLTQIKTKESRMAFRKAIELDQADPLPRLGLGLALIRDGKLKEGRKEIEIAVALDPNNSLIRSYLGKAYFEEKRNNRARDQYAIAKELDPLDPTPWFYDALRKQTVNRPVEALEDLNKSIELNDNRAVYRSRLQLDQDLAARSASLARIYDELGFQQLALAEGWKSLGADPTNYSAHRFLSDSYSVLPRHEIARVSELLQSQLLQPLNINPVPPELAESKLFTLSATGAADASLNEYNSLFNRNRVALLSSVLGGENGTVGDEVVLSGLWGRFSGSVGQFHYQTEGFRPNNDRELNLYNAFTQVSLSPSTSVQAEFRHSDLERGDLTVLFDPNLILRDFREDIKSDSVRLGLRHSFGPNSDLLISLTRRTDKTDQKDTLSLEQTGYLAEGQYLFHSERFSVISGLGHFNGKSELTDLTFDSELTKTDTRHNNFYVYSLFSYPKNVTWTLGGSADFFNTDDKGFSSEQFNPKFGVSWKPFPVTTLRTSAFRVLKRSLLSDQTLEPTNVAGFNQFFDDAEATDSWRYGIGLDQKLPANLYCGAEFSQRDLTVKALVPEIQGGNFAINLREADWKEQLARAYLYWIPHPWFALGTEYQFEKFTRPDNVMGEESIARLETNRIGFGVGFFHPMGFSVKLKPTYVDQDGFFGLQRLFTPPSHLKDHFWVLDAAIGYRLPRRLGLITIEVRNLLDEKFRFQDTDPLNPAIIPDRMILGRFTLAF